MDERELYRFWVFACDQYYPSGGTDDCVGRFKTQEEADAFARTLFYDYVYVVDVVAESEKPVRKE